MNGETTQWMRPESKVPKFPDDMPASVKVQIHCVETLRSQSLTTFTELGLRATDV
jgi:hypothetical protein